MKVTVAVARARAAAVGARGAETGGGRRGACELERRPAPDEVAARPGLLCPASSPQAGPQRNKKMDSQLQSAMCQSLQPVGGRRHQDTAREETHYNSVPQTSSARARGLPASARLDLFPPQHRTPPGGKGPFVLTMRSL